MAMRAFAVPGLLAIVLAAPAWPAAQDRAVAVPGMKVLLQNDRVRVQFHDVAVGDTTPMHSHPACAGPSRRAMPRRRSHCACPSSEGSRR